jgi:putative transcriptional regulator
MIWNKQRLLRKGLQFIRRILAPHPFRAGVIKMAGSHFDRLAARRGNGRMLFLKICSRQIFLLAGMLCGVPVFADSLPVLLDAGTFNVPAKGLFLVASKKMRSPVFSRTVILLVKAGKRGAVGVIVNRPTPHSFGEALPQLKELKGAGSAIFEGGPVEPRRLQALFRSPDQPPQSEQVFAGIYYSGSEQVVLEQVQTGVPASALRIYAGYAGWAPGQLEQELRRGGWHLVSADPEILFREKPGAIWQELLPAPAPRWTWELFPDDLNSAQENKLFKLAIEGLAVEVLHD